MTRRAFSLIELVIVLMIAVAVAMIAAPRLAAAGYQGRLNGAELRLIHEFRAVGERSLDRGRSHLIVFDVTSHEMRVFEGTEGAKGDLVRTIRFADDPYAVRFQSVSISDTKAQIAVSAFGVYSASATVTIQSSGNSRAVNLSGQADGTPVAPDPSDSGVINLLDGLIKGVDIL